MYKLHFEDLLEELVEEFPINGLDFIEYSVDINTRAFNQGKQVDIATAKRMITSIADFLAYHGYIEDWDFYEVDNYDEDILEINLYDDWHRCYDVHLIEYGIHFYLPYDK